MLMFWKPWKQISYVQNNNNGPNFEPLELHEKPSIKILPNVSCLCLTILYEMLFVLYITGAFFSLVYYCINNHRMQPFLGIT